MRKQTVRRGLIVLIGGIGLTLLLLGFLAIWLPSQTAPFTGSNRSVDLVAMYEQVPFLKLVSGVLFLAGLAVVVGGATLVVGFVLGEK
jgi:hypothetical protein